MNANRETTNYPKGVSAALRMKPGAPNKVVERLDVALDVCITRMSF